MKRLHFVHTLPRHPVDRAVEMEAKTGVAGYITYQLLRRDGSVKAESTFKNIITDVGLDLLLGRGNPSNGNNASTLVQPNIMYGALGTGSTTPTAADTTLSSELASPSTNRTNSNGGYSSTSGYVSGPPDYWWFKNTFLFDYTQSNGNLTEFGIIQGTGGGNMFTHQLLKDSGGTPTTIVKTSDEQLRIIYEFRVYPPTSDSTQSAFTISGVDYDITTRAANANNAAAWGGYDGYFNSGFTASTCPVYALETGTLGARTTIPTGTAIVYNVNPVAQAYTNGTFYRDIRYEWGPLVANFAGGIGSVIYRPGSGNNTANSMFQSSFSPAFTKDNTKRLRLDIRYTIDRV